MLEFQQSPYLPLQRNFRVQTTEELASELDKSYVDIAGRVNDRTIGLFAVDYAAITGEKWFLAGQPGKAQTFRRVFTFTTTAAINHGLTFSQINGFTRIYGQYTDGTNWYGIIAATTTAIAGQLSVYISPTQIVFVSGGAPAVQSGRVILEWLSFS